MYGWPYLTVRLSFEILVNQSKKKKKLIASLFYLNRKKNHSQFKYFDKALILVVGLSLHTHTHTFIFYIACVRIY